MVHRFVPLMIIKIVSHLPNCFCCRCLIFNRYSRETCCNIKLHMISFKNILIFIIDFDHFISFNTLIIITFDWSCLKSIKLFLYPISSFIRIKLRGLFLFLCFFLLIRWWGRGFSSYFNIIRGKKSILLWFSNQMAIPPSILVCLLYKQFLSSFKTQIFYLLMLLLQSLLSLLFKLKSLLFCSLSFFGFYFLLRILLSLQSLFLTIIL